MAENIDMKFINLQALQKSDEAWFCKELVQGFMTIYTDKTFFIIESDKPKLLGPVNLKEKQEWLLSSAKELFRDYVLSERGLLRFQNNI